jgi:hypothetical protein
MLLDPVTGKPKDIVGIVTIVGIVAAGIKIASSKELRRSCRDCCRGCCCVCLFFTPFVLIPAVASGIKTNSAPTACDCVRAENSSAGRCDWTLTSAGHLAQRTKPDFNCMSWCAFSPTRCGCSLSNCPVTLCDCAIPTCSAGSVWAYGFCFMWITFLAVMSLLLLCPHAIRRFPSDGVRVEGVCIGKRLVVLLEKRKCCQKRPTIVTTELDIQDKSWFGCGCRNLKNGFPEKFYLVTVAYGRHSSATHFVKEFRVPSHHFGDYSEHDTSPGVKYERNEPLLAELTRAGGNAAPISCSRRVSHLKLIWQMHLTAQHTLELGMPRQLAGVTLKHGHVQ